MVITATAVVRKGHANRPRSGGRLMSCDKWARNSMDWVGRVYLDCLEELHLLAQGRLGVASKEGNDLLGEGYPRS